MLRVLFLFLVLIASVVVGPMLAGHQGYVLIQTDSYNVETSVTGLVIMVILLFLVLFVIEWFLRHIFHTGARTRGWFIGRKRHRAHKQTKAALIKLAEGDYKQVEKLLTRNADHAEQPVVNYLLAAEAAQQRGDGFRTNQYLERAAEVADTDQLPVDITRVRIQLAQGEAHAARHGIDRLLNQAPRHPEVLRLAEQAYLQTGAYASLLEILPAMSKINLHTEDELQALQQQAYIGLMNQAMADEGSDGLKLWWKEQSRRTRHEVPLQVAMVEHLIECDDHDLAQDIVLSSLKRQYDERLVLLLPRIKSGNPEQLEKALRQQIKQHGTTPLLSSTLGQLLMKHGEWQQASEAFNEALKQRPDAYDYAWLADALEKLHRPDEAAQMRREGLMLTLKQDSE
ncbi:MULTISPECIES: protoheme IX biogenesis protein HemY [unclassified Serratia (in: enterobacteria)]|uniref:protoheme IX biogenesis protein HemY n=1 Tax=unclassified Serratia (in: enterobacteria) TaxID=2647522 RepID=UPI0005040B43|nr:MULTISPECIES: protoheme IX biogenesis protein HemY [unclassified Serratia (in: enterobacteria)]KFK93659.1 protoheme IX biogenesis protein [Serratia sp. Ag2]KFK98976.1 protoheme IX biogenesis protein [Serratia sp. Ag1]